MKKITVSILMLFMFCCSLLAQDGRQRTVETIVQDVMAALPAQNMSDCYANMADLADAAPASVTYLASKLQPAQAKANNLLEYAISGVVRYAADPANADVKANVMKGIEDAIASVEDKYNRQFLEAQLRLMQPFTDNFPGQMESAYPAADAKSLLKSKSSHERCQALWILAETLGQESQKIILSALKSDDRDVRANAFLAYEDLADDAFYAQVAKLYKKLSPEAKADVLYWFGEKDVKSQLPLVISELNAGGELGAAAIDAAGKLGDIQVAHTLLGMLGGEYTSEAVAALRHIKADISTAVAEAFAGADNKKTAALLALASVKGNNKAAAAVLELSKSGDKTLASLAQATLANVVTSEDFAEIAAMVDAEGGVQLVNALKSTLNGLSDDDKFNKVNAFVAHAKDPENFYPVIASTNADAAVAFLADRYKAGSDSALEALAAIGNKNAAPILLEAADRNQAYLKNFVDLVKSSDFKENHKCDYYCRALDKATDKSVKSYIVNALGSIPTMRSFAAVGSCIDDPDLMRHAADAAKKIAAKNAAGIDYYQLKDVLAKASQYYQQAGGADDGYAVDEIKKILDSVKPYEKYRLTEEEKALGYEILYDGTDLSKWVGDKVGYQSVNGCIEVSATYGDSKNLYTEKEYKDFVLRFEFCFLRSGVNNGVGIRTPMGVDAAYHGMCEVQVLDHDAPIYADLRPYQVHGSVYGIVPAKRIVHKPLGEWSTMEIRVVGDNVKVTVNGEVINDADVRKACKGMNVAPDGSKKNPYTVDGRNHPGLFNKTGHVGFLGHGEGLRYRNVRILDLSAKK